MSRSLSLAAVVIVLMAVDLCCGQYPQHQFASVAEHQFIPVSADQPMPANNQFLHAQPQFANGSDGPPMGGSVYQPAISDGYCCDDCNAGFSGCRSCFGSRHTGRRAPVRNLVRASRIQPDCADCNWGPMYLSLFGGVSFLDNFDTRFTFDNGMMGELGIRETGFSMEDGVASGASIGRYFYRQGRVELEYTYRDNAVGEFQQFTYSDDLSTPQINDTLIAAITLPADGSVESSSLVVNFLFDFKPRTVGCMNAYAGGGIGGVAVDGDAVSVGTTFVFDDAALAFQGIAGINYPVRDRLDLFTEYRYLGSDNVRVDQIDGAGNTTSLGNFRLDTHNVVFGIRILR